MKEEIRVFIDRDRLEITKLNINRKPSIKTKKCNAKKGQFSCTIWGSPWCDDCALYR